MNKYIATGIMGNDFDTIENGLKMSLAVRQEDKSTLWMRVFIFGKTAEACSNYLKKGSKVLVEGKLAMSKADNVVVIADRVEYL